jgi:ergothioneine biosynthesis protein EgtB
MMDIDAACSLNRPAGPTRPGSRVQTVRPQPLPERFRIVRSASLQLADPLSVEDQCVQSMPEASPTKWHLAHTTWFFEAIVLQPHAPGYRCFDPRFTHLFNSYYEAFGQRHARERRAMLTRPSLDEVHAYRRYVDDAVEALFASGRPGSAAEGLLELGLHHEQQHQELILTDIKHAFYLNPLKPAYRHSDVASPHPPAPATWIAHEGGIQPIGHAGEGFAFDNEGPRHPVLLAPFELASRPVSCADYLEFILDGGYQRADLWLSDGWAAVKVQGWNAPLYWEADGPGRFNVFTLHGVRPLDPGEAVCHLSFYEACAYAKWARARLPTEFEWEAAAAAWPGPREGAGPVGLHPPSCDARDRLEPICGPVWQWTRSSYDPYPGSRPAAGPVGEYNAKFMVGQIVLRGGSCATPLGHIRITYRNYFAPGTRWQFSGLRLARDA